jgi:hypothetical protein
MSFFLGITRATSLYQIAARKRKASERAANDRLHVTNSSNSPPLGGYAIRSFVSIASPPLRRGFEFRMLGNVPDILRERLRIRGGDGVECSGLDLPRVRGAVELRLAQEMEHFARCVTGMEEPQATGRTGASGKNSSTPATSRREQDGASCCHWVPRR